MLPARGGCFDAIVFVKAFLNQNHTSKITIAFGGNYSVTEIITVIWWLHLSKILVYKGKKKIAFQYFENGKVSKTNDIEKAFTFVLRCAADRPLIVNRKREKYSARYKPTTILCLKNCKDQIHWLKFIQKIHQYERNYLIINGPNKSDLGGDLMDISLINPRLLIKQKNTDYSENLTLDELICADLIDFKKDETLSQIALKVEKFIGKIGVDYTSKIVKSLVKIIRNNVEDRTCDTFYITDTPSIECIATHQIAIEKNTLPTLLPHSFTAIHEYDIKSYYKAYSYFSSKNISPFTVSEPDRTKKELIFNVNNPLKSDLNNRSNFWKAIQKIFFLKKYTFINFLLIKRKFFDYLITKNYKKSLKLSCVKIGYIANAEMDQLNNLVNFKQEILLLYKLNRKFHEKYQIKSHFFIRGKKGYFPVKICKKFFESCNSSYIRNPSFDIGSGTLKTFGQNMDLIFFIFTTSAILELMLQGVLCIKLEDEELSLFTHEYLSFPIDIMPKMSLAEVESLDLGKFEHLAKIQHKQYEWAKLQVVDQANNGGL